jgi:hypothetical protein
MGGRRVHAAPTQSTQLGREIMDMNHCKKSRKPIGLMVIARGVLAVSSHEPILSPVKITAIEKRRATWFFSASASRLVLGSLDSEEREIECGTEKSAFRIE